MKVRLQVTRIQGRELSPGEQAILMREIEARLERLASAAPNEEIRGGCALMIDDAARRLLPHIKSALQRKP